MILEFGYLALLFLSGAIALRALGATPAGSACLGYLAGISVYVVWGTLQLVTPAPTTPFLTMALTVATASGLAFWKRRGLHVERKTILYLAAGLFVIAVAVVLLRNLHLVKWHTDSFRYISIGALIANENFHEVSSNFLRLRFPAIPLLHAPANLWDEFYVRALTPLIALSAIASIGWIFLSSSVAKTAGRSGIAALCLALAFLISTNRFIWHAFYLNGHLLLAALFLVVVGIGWLLDKREENDLPGLAFLQAAAVPAMVLTRPEGFLIAGAAVAPTLLSSRLGWRTRAMLLVSLGVAVCAWQGLIMMRASAFWSAPGLPIFAIGLLCVFAAPLLSWKMLSLQRLLLLGVAEACLLGILVVLAIGDPAHFEATATAILHNLAGSGAWGYMPVMLVGVVTFATVFCREPGMALLRFPLAHSLLIYLVIGLLRNAPYRIGEGDTFNRMFVQLVPAAILLIAVAAASSRWGVRLPMRQEFRSVMDSLIRTLHPSAAERTPPSELHSQRRSRSTSWRRTQGQD